MFRIAALALAAIGTTGPVFAADAQEMTEVEKIIDRAIGLMAQARDYSVESDDGYVATMLEGGEQSFNRTSTYRSYRESGRYWLDARSPNNAYRSIAWSDGKALHRFVINPDHGVAGEICEQPLLRGDYSLIGRHKFNNLSPLGASAQQIMMQGREGKFKGAKYSGRRQLRGDECDVIEFSRDINGPGWSRVRERYPQVPQTAADTHTIYLRVADGRLLRSESTSWSMKSVNGKEPDPPMPNARTYSWNDFWYGAALPDAEVDEGRFAAAVKDVMGGKTPKTVAGGDPWQGKSLPAIDLMALDGKPLRWEDFQGKVLVVETWFIGCTYCKYAFTYYDRVREQLKDKDVIFMALNTGDEKRNSTAQIQEWIGKSGKTFGFLWAKSMEPSREVDRKLNFDGAPLFFVVGADGRIVASYNGYNYGNGGEDPRLLEALKGAGVQL